MLASPFLVVSSAAVIRVVTQRFSPANGLVGEKRCVTTLITAAEETTFSRGSFVFSESRVKVSLPVSPMKEAWQSEYLIL